MNWIRISFLAVLASTGCMESGFHKTLDGDGANGAAIEVDPPELEYGLLSKGEQEVLSFTIHSVGTGDLQVENILIDGGVGAFSLFTEEFGYMLPPGASQEVEVAFSPMAASCVAKWASAGRRAARSAPG